MNLSLIMTRVFSPVTVGMNRQCIPLHTDTHACTPQTDNIYNICYVLYMYREHARRAKSARYDCNRIGGGVRCVCACVRALQFAWNS